LTLGGNLLPNFLNSTQNKLERVIEEADSELLMVNFNLRSKVFINKTIEAHKRAA